MVSVDFDNSFFERLNTQEAYRVDDRHMTEFWNVLKSQISVQFIQDFGIQSLLDRMHLGALSQYKDGGDVSTLHNARSGVFIDEEHARRFNESYDRKNYEGRVIKDNNGNIVKDTRLKTQRKEMFQKEDEIYDGYTHKKLSKDGTTHLDHITSAKHIHDNDKARLFLSDDDRNDMAVSEKNLTPIDGRMNQSKGESDLSEWNETTNKGQNQTNHERFDTDNDAIQVKKQASENFVRKTVNRGQIKEFNSAARQRGMQQAKRQLYGLFMYEFSDILIDEMRIFASNWTNYATMSDKLENVKLMFKRVRERVRERLLNIRQLVSDGSEAFFGGFISGVLGTLVETVLNSFMTVIKSWGKVLQAGLGSFIQVVKMIATNPEHLPTRELMKVALKTLSIGVNTAIGLTIGEKIQASLKTILPDVLADVISTGLAALIGGSLSALALYSIDHFGEMMKQFSKLVETGIADLKTGLRVTEREIVASYERAITRVDSAYAEILESIEEQYKELDRLSNLAHDMSCLASDQLTSSVAYAEESGVNQNKILHDSDEISKYFLR